MGSIWRVFSLDLLKDYRDTVISTFHLILYTNRNIRLQRYCNIHLPLNLIHKQKYKITEIL